MIKRKLLAKKALPQGEAWAQIDLATPQNLANIGILLYWTWFFLINSECIHCWKVFNCCNKRDNLDFFKSAYGPNSFLFWFVLTPLLPFMLAVEGQNEEEDQTRLIKRTNKRRILKKEYCELKFQQDSLEWVTLWRTSVGDMVWCKLGGNELALDNIIDFC